MDAIEIANEFVDSASTHADLQSLTSDFQRSLETFGFRYFACGSHVDPLHPAQAIMILNYPREWVELYSERKLHCLDPVFLYCDRMGVPFLWDSDTFLSRTNAAQRRMLKEAKRHGLAHGFTVPLYAPFGMAPTRGSCSVIPYSPTVDRKARSAAQLMAEALFSAAAHLLAPSCCASEWPRLSRRERQCLTHWGNGKSDAVMELLLGLKRATIHGYLENAKRKLNVSTRQQAMAAALALNQISFSELIYMPSEAKGKTERAALLPHTKNPSS